MNETFYKRGPFLPFTPAADYTGKLGYGVTLAGATATLSASATVVARGVIAEPGFADAAGNLLPVTVGIIGALSGAVRVKISATSAAGVAGDMLIQAADGTWTKDTGAGARVQSFMACDAYAPGDLVDAVPQTPLSLT